MIVNLSIDLERHDGLVEVAGRQYMFPKGTKLARSASGDILYVLEPDGTLRALVEDGELPHVEDIREPILKMYFGGLQPH